MATERKRNRILLEWWAETDDTQEVIELLKLDCLDEFVVAVYSESNVPNE